jgi:hypothetical protein
VNCSKVYIGDVSTTTAGDIQAFTTLLQGVTQIQGSVAIGCNFALPLFPDQCPGSSITEAQLLAMLGEVREITGFLEGAFSKNVG